MPTYALQFAALQWARDAGCTHYDLWGIPPTDEPPDAAQGEQQNVRDGLWGVYRFKQGFGGDVVTYPGIFVRQYRPLWAACVRALATAGGPRMSGPPTRDAAAPALRAPCGSRCAAGYWG